MASSVVQPAIHHCQLLLLSGATCHPPVPAPDRSRSVDCPPRRSDLGSASAGIHQMVDAAGSAADLPGLYLGPWTPGNIAQFPAPLGNYPLFICFRHTAIFLRTWSRGNVTLTMCVPSYLIISDELSRDQSMTNRRSRSPPRAVCQGY